MKPVLVNMQVRALCPNCNAVTSFESPASGGGSQWLLIENGAFPFQGRTYSRVLYLFLRCAGCRRGAVAKAYDDGNANAGVLEEFYPVAIDRAPLPNNTPADLVSECREAEVCLAYGALRAASALFRSTLEKALKANGYTTGSLQQKIDEAAADGVITASRKQRAHDDIRVLGNDVLHDAWRQIAFDEAELAHRYTQRVLEDLYDDRPTAEAVLKSKGRIP